MWHVTTPAAGKQRRRRRLRHHAWRAPMTAGARLSTTSRARPGKRSTPHPPPTRCRPAADRGGDGRRRRTACRRPRGFRPVGTPGRSSQWVCPLVGSTARPSQRRCPLIGSALSKATVLSSAFNDASPLDRGSHLQRVQRLLHRLPSKLLCAQPSRRLDAISAAAPSQRLSPLDGSARSTALPSQRSRPLSGSALPTALPSQRLLRSLPSQRQLPPPTLTAATAGLAALPCAGLSPLNGIFNGPALSTAAPSPALPYQRYRPLHGPAPSTPCRPQTTTDRTHIDLKSTTDRQIDPRIDTGIEPKTAATGPHIDPDGPRLDLDSTSTLPQLDPRTTLWRGLGPFIKGGKIPATLRPTLLL